jgi:hypothetical protein
MWGKYPSGPQVDEVRGFVGAKAKNAAPGIEGDRDRVLDRNNPIRAAQSNLSKSIIKQEHQPIRVVSPAVSSSRQAHLFLGQSKSTILLHEPAAELDRAVQRVQEGSNQEYAHTSKDVDPIFSMKNWEK